MQRIFRVLFSLVGALSISSCESAERTFYQSQELVNFMETWNWGEAELQDIKVRNVVLCGVFKSFDHDNELLHIVSFSPLSDQRIKLSALRIESSRGETRLDLFEENSIAIYLQEQNKQTGYFNGAVEIGKIENKKLEEISSGSGFNLVFEGSLLNGVGSSDFSHSCSISRMTETYLVQR